MKKFVSILLALMLCACLATASAEASFAVSDLNYTSFLFCSGVGGWYTELVFGENGTFSGSFMDSEMGSVGDGYPNGTVYLCSFEGSMTAGEQLNAYTWRLNLNELTIPEADSVIDGGILYAVVDSVYGLENTDDIVVYLPGAPVSELPEAFLSWAHLEDIGNPDTLPFYAIYNVTDQCGFVGQ